MEGTSGVLLQRLQELKLWQQTHENILNKHLDENETSSMYKTIEGLSGFDSSGNADDLPKQTKSFAQMLEERLSYETGGPKDFIPKPKKPFLKKGSGLKRFRMTPADLKVPITTKQSQRKPEQKLRVDSNVNTLNLAEFTEKKKPQWEKCVEENGDNNQNSEPSPMALNQNETEQELKMFEALEKRADNSSFCSTNSSVVRILDGTPVKKTYQSNSTKPQKHVQWKNVIDDEDDNDESMNDNGRRLPKVDLAKFLSHLQQQITENPLLGISEECSVNERDEEDEENDDEKWSTTTGSDLSINTQDLENDCPSVQPPSPTESMLKPKIAQNVLLEKTESSGTTTTKYRSMDDIIENNENRQTFTNFDNREKYNKNKEFIECDHSSCISDQSQSKYEQELRTKIEECTKKINEVLKEKYLLTEMDKRLKQQHERWEKEMKLKQIEFEEKKLIFLKEIEEEKRKLAKEKSVFNIYTKDSQNRTTKKERQEISDLKREIADLKESLKLKESKNGMTQARLRNQIKQLEKENGNLKEEVEKLTKENARLTAENKMNRKSNDQKILKEINKNISKLASKQQEQQQQTPPQIENSNALDKETIDLERKYRNLITQNLPSVTLNDSSKIDRTEHILKDGSKEIRYKNGNIKTISPDGNQTNIKYFNGDIKQMSLVDGTIKYYYHDKNIWQTTYADGLEIIEFPDGYQEKRYPDGKCEVIFEDGTIQTILPNGTQIVKYPDNSFLEINQDGTKVLTLQNGQKEIETKDHKRREYPDGTVKIIYSDNSQETRYANGRIRKKDPQGNLILDTDQL